MKGLAPTLLLGGNNGGPHAPGDALRLCAILSATVALCSLTLLLALGDCGVEVRLSILYSAPYKGWGLKGERKRRSLFTHVYSMRAALHTAGSTARAARHSRGRSVVPYHNFNTPPLDTKNGAK